MSADHIHNCDDVDNIKNGQNSQLRPRRIRKSTAGTRKVQHEWTDDEIHRLIDCVENHRILWDSTLPEYKLGKQAVWRSLMNDLGIDGVDLKQAKIKWSSLRVTYAVNLAKAKTRKSHTVTWKFFTHMMFLENHTKATSNASHPSNEDENSTSSSSASASSSASSSSSSSSEAEEAQSERKRSRSRSPSPPPSPSPPKTLTPSVTPEVSLPNGKVTTTTTNLYPSDTNSTFCDNLLAELRTLSDTRARTLRYKLARIMMDFMEDDQHQIASYCSKPS